MLSFEAARALIFERITPAQPAREEVSLEASLSRVLAEPALADRDIPALDRSVRDGYAVRHADLPGPLPIFGESAAGSSASTLPPGMALGIMTGAPLPAGADTVIMVEHTERTGNSMLFTGTAEQGQFISRRAEEACASETLIPAGKRLTPADIALLAATGQSAISVFRLPTVALLATGDELVPINAAPAPHQIRNSNVHALAAQVRRAGGIPLILPVAPDNQKETRDLIEGALQADLLLLSGGVSAGKYDFVEAALADLGAEFYFDRVAIQPGQPVVFGCVRGRPFFGLPGNPASTLVTFEIFARAALALLGGETNPLLPLTLARLTVPFSHKPGLTRFLPACLDANAAITPVPWRGSSDMPAVSRANCFLVADPATPHYPAGSPISALLF